MAKKFTHRVTAIYVLLTCGAVLGDLVAKPAVWIEYLVAVPLIVCYFFAYHWAAEKDSRSLK